MTRIKELRLEKKLLQKDIAAVLGVERSLYTRYELGATNPPLDVILKLSSFYGVTTDYILGTSNYRYPLVNNDPELTAYLDELKNHPEMRMLFSLTKTATKKDVEKAVEIIEAYLRK